MRYVFPLEKGALLATNKLDVVFDPAIDCAGKYSGTCSTGAARPTPGFRTLLRANYKSGPLRLSPELNYVGELDLSVDSGPNQRGTQKGTHVGQKGSAIDGAVNHHRRGQRVTAQGGHEGGGLPVAVRHGGDAALPAGCAAARRGHTGAGPRLVEKDQACVIPARLLLPPFTACLLHVVALLLAGVQRFF